MEEEKIYEEPNLMQGSRIDFFISYHSRDQRWAEWIAWQLQNAKSKYSTIFPNRNLQASFSFAEEMQEATKKAQRMIVVLSSNYLFALSDEPEEIRKIIQRESQNETILLVYVEACDHKGAFASTTSIELIEQAEARACKRLLDRVSGKPTTSGLLLEGQQSLHEKPRFREKPRFPPDPPPIWNVPRRNSYFTDREKILENIYNAFRRRSNELIQPQAINGPEGIGKTQIAIEYAHRYQSEYRFVLWIRADSPETWLPDFITIADMLNLDEKNDPVRVISAVLRWLNTPEHTDWLLILDNYEVSQQSLKLIPTAGQGHILLTTCAQAIKSIAHPIQLEKIELEEGAVYLLRRIGILALDAPFKNVSDIDRTQALEIANEMDGLPLALDQVCAYIDEVGCLLTDYIDLYKKERAKLLARRGQSVFDHPKSVATTWNLSLQKIHDANSTAYELLQFCAFLHPNNIPEEIFISGVANFANGFYEAIAEIRKYSFIHRDPASKTLTVHRLLQAVLIDQMSELTQHQYAELVVRAVARVLPTSEQEKSERSPLYSLQLEACAKLIKYWKMDFSEAIRLHQEYLQGQAKSIQDEQLIEPIKTIGTKQAQEKPLQSKKTINVFCAFNVKDKEMLKRIELHLDNLKETSISLWHKRKLSPGMNEEAAVKDYLNSAHIILLLISADFIGSEDWRSIKERIKERMNTEEARVIPIRLQPFDWHEIPFSQLIPLPTDGKPVTSWSNHEAAFEDITQGIQKVIEELNSNNFP